MKRWGVLFLFLIFVFIFLFFNLHFFQNSGVMGFKGLSMSGKNKGNNKEKQKNRIWLILFKK